MSKKLNPYLFILLKDKKIILWNYYDHTQFEISKEELNALINFNLGLKTNNLPTEFIDHNIITDYFPQPEWGWDDLSLIYHIGSSNLLVNSSSDPTIWAQEYYEYSSKHEPPLPILDFSGPIIKLPAPEFEKMEKLNLWDLMCKRSTSRNFKNQEVQLQDFVRVIYSGFGRTEHIWQELQDNNFAQTGYRKAHPSGGGIHPLEGFIFVYNVEKIDPGIYYYDWINHSLIKINQVPSYSELIEIFYGQFYIENISFGVLVANNFEKEWSKYTHSRSYRDVYTDLGHASQSMLLMATNFDLLTWESAWFKDKSLSSLCQVNGISMAPSFFLGFGWGEKKGIPRSFDSL